MNDFEQFEPYWPGLALRARNIFGTLEWVKTWWRHFEKGRGIVVHARPGVAILPMFVEKNGPFRLLRFMGAPHSDEVGPICAPEDREDAAELLRGLFGGSERFHLFLGDGMTPGWAGLIGARVAERTSSPVVSLDVTNWDDFLAARSSNFRQQLRGAERRLQKRGAVYRLATADTLEHDLDTLFRLHRERWPGSPWFTPAEAFHRDFAAVALDRGWLRLWTLELDGQPAASWLGYRFAGVESYYQAGRDPSLQRERVGFVLLAHTIREALQDGMSEYRLLRGDEAFKSRFATSDPGLETLARPRGLLGRVALALRTARRRAT